jgi:hypothetical protein
MLRLLRDAGIAIGSLVAGLLCVGLVGPFIAWVVPPDSLPLLGLILGGVIFADIMRREHQGHGGGQPLARA